MALFGGITLPGKPDLENIRKLDLLPMQSIREMGQYGMAVDIPYLQQLDEEITGEMKELRYNICSYVPSEKLDEFIKRSGMEDEDADTSSDTYGLPLNIDSNEQLSKLMFEVLGIGAGKQLKTTKSGNRLSTGKKQLEQLKREHPVVPLILMYKEYSKVRSSNTSTFPTMAKLHREGRGCWCGLDHNSDTYRLHSEILGTRTTTGRYASKRPNLQNIGARTALGRRVRAAFIATPGTKIVGADFSQVEMRLGGHYSRDKNLIRIFIENLDPHTTTARRVFKTDTPDKMTQRDPCKNVNFGIFYGLSGPGLYDLMAVTYATAGIEMPDWLTVEWCDDLIKQWFVEYNGVLEYLGEQHHRARRYNLVWSLFGRIRRVPEARSVHKRIISAGLRQAGNQPIQGTCADMMRLAIAMVHALIVVPLRRDGIWCRMLMTIHDELLLEVEEKYAEMVRGMMVSVFESVLVDEVTGENMCRVPIRADGKIMDRWSK